MSRATTEQRTTERRAADQSRQRPLRRVAAGWWVYSYGSRGGDWAEVVSATSEHGPDGRARVRLVLRDARGRRVLIENHPAYPASCLTARQARQLGLGARR